MIRCRQCNRKINFKEDYVSFPKENAFEHLLCFMIKTKLIEGMELIKERTEILKGIDKIFKELKKATSPPSGRKGA